MFGRRRTSGKRHIQLIDAFAQSLCFGYQMICSGQQFRALRGFDSRCKQDPDATILSRGLSHLRKLCFLAIKE
nr:hypothetical protein TR92_04160 [Brucella anthropi]